MTVGISYDHMEFFYASLIFLSVLFMEEAVKGEKKIIQIERTTHGPFPNEVYNCELAFCWEKGDYLH